MDLLIFLKDKRFFILIFAIVFAASAFFYEFFILPDSFEASFLISFYKAPESGSSYQYEGFYVLKTIEEFTNIMHQIANSYAFEKKLYVDDFRKFLKSKNTEVKKISYNSLYFSLVDADKESADALSKKAQKLIRSEVDYFNDKFFKNSPASVSFEVIPSSKLQKNKWLTVLSYFFVGTALGLFVALFFNFFGRPARLREGSQE